MDKIAIISDVHGNLSALNAVLSDIEKRQIKRIFCLGDSVVKGVHPDLVVDKLREVCEVMLIGNCDYSTCSSIAKERNYWTRRVIGENRAEFLSNLPVSFEFYLSGHLVRLFHSSPLGLNKIYNPMFSNKNSSHYKYELKSPDLLFQNTDFIGKTSSDPIPDIVGYGHIHTPFVSRFNNKTLFNTGSVGVPIEMLNTDVNDKTNKFSTLSSYIILEGFYGSKNLDSISFNLVRVPYDIEKEIEDIKNSDMPGKDMAIKRLQSAIQDEYEF